MSSLHHTCGILFTLCDPQTLLTAGIQQLGWATLDCPFRGAEGVGDAPDSYAYDGKRLRKWNVKCSPYGQAWTPGASPMQGRGGTVWQR